MIDVKDLQIGNKVLYQKKVVEIATIHITGTIGILNGSKDFIVPVSCSDIEPIEVTEDLLLKLNFDSSGYPNEYGYANYEKDINDKYSVSICKSKKNNYYCDVDKYVDGTGIFCFQYLHELQNGIRLITKGDLEVCL